MRKKKQEKIGRKIKVLLLFSGGLDSILAVKLLEEQGIKVTGLTFVSYFFDDKLAREMAKQIKIKLKTIDFSEEHLAMVKNPRYGYGKNINPCIDCHVLMLKKAKELAEIGKMKNDQRFDFIATGEVLGERPMSQNKQALELIEKKAGLSGYLLRPLSAKLLKPTVVEEKGLVNRNYLLDISGRGRSRQITLAKKFGIKKYPTPSGGCLLTDILFSRRLKELLDKWPQSKDNDIKLLKLGRHFWFKSDKIVVGRNKKENEELEKLFQKDDLLVRPKNFSGPTILLRGKNKLRQESLAEAQKLIIRYSPKLKKELGLASKK